MGEFDRLAVARYGHESYYPEGLDWLKDRITQV